MNARSYKLIFILLSISVLSILALQGFWLRSFYLQKLDQFHVSVYSALEQVGNKLKERATISAVKDEVFVKTMPPKKFQALRNFSNEFSVITDKKGRQIKTIRNFDDNGSESSVVSSSDSVYIISTPGANAIISSSSHSNGKTSVHSSVRIVRGSSDKEEIQILGLDSARSDLEKRMKKSSKLVKHLVTDKEMGPLMDKLLLEIKDVDTEFNNPDTVHKLIADVLQNKGITLPFESAIRSSKGKDTATVYSKVFDPNKSYYLSDLSLDNILKNKRALLLQFTGNQDPILASMSGLLWLSLIFSLLIIGLFSFALRILQKQKQISELKADFVNNMTHELKTPIATISLALDAMNNPEVRDNPYRIYEYNRILKEENNKLNKHVERVLQISQLEKGSIQLQKTEADLVFLVNRAIGNFALRIKESGAKVHCLSSSPSVLMKADLTHLSSVFSNLIDNALKYSGNICELKIEILERAREVIIVFEDRGIGFDPSQREKIFEKFYRVQGGDLHEVKGFGLGLSYCRNIVEMHGGRIEAEGNPGKGSTFTIVLPKGIDNG